MNIRILLSVIAVILSASLNLSAQKNPDSSPSSDSSLNLIAEVDHSIQNPWFPKGSITVGYQDLYFAGRVSKPVMLTPSVWVDISLEWPSGLYGSWTQYENLDRDADIAFPGTEISESLVSFGYKWRWQETVFKLQSNLINIHSHDKWFDDDRLALELYISQPFKFEWEGKHVLTPELRIGWFSFWNEIDQGVPFALPALSHVWDEPFHFKNIALRSRLAVEIDGGFRKHDAGAFLQFESALQWKLSEHLTLTLPGWRFIEPFSSNRNDGRGESWNTFFTSLTYRF